MLTLIFDLVGLVIAEQKAAARMMGREESGSGVNGADAEAVPDISRLIWAGRYYLYNLMAIVKSMKEEFGIPNLVIPAFTWNIQN